MPTPDELGPARAPGVEIAERYVLERKLGEGGMGTVWAARNKLTYRRVAMKFLRANVRSESMRHRFLREARAAGTLDHPNVCEVLDVLEIDEAELVLVLELLEGETLAQHLAKRGRLSTEETAGLLLPVVSAIGTAHAHGIIHRDLKPENIFVTRDRGMKVLDFGIAKVRADAADATGAALTATGSLLGTPAYMAPEQVFGESDIDHGADIWALGLVLYQCLAGVLPTGDGAVNVGQVLKTIVARPIRPLGELAADVPDDVRDIVMRMLARVRAKRPATLQETFDVLRRHTEVRAPAFGEPNRTTDPPRSAASPADTFSLLEGEANEAPDRLATAASPLTSLRGVAGVPAPLPGRWRNTALLATVAVTLSLIGWQSLRWARTASSSASSPTAEIGFPRPPVERHTAMQPSASPPSDVQQQTPAGSAKRAPPQAHSTRVRGVPAPRAAPSTSASTRIDPLGDSR